MITVVVLGSGAGAPSPRRAPPGLLLRAGSGAAFLVDPGPGALHRAALSGVTPPDVKGVFLTHHHPDHTLDVMSLLFARKSVLYEGRVPVLLLFGPEGTKDLYRRMAGLYGRWVEEPADRLRIVEVDPGRCGGKSGKEAGGAPVETDSLSVATGEGGLAISEKKGPGLLEVAFLPVRHTERSVGYRFRSGGSAIALSGDSERCDSLVELGRGADLLFLECSVPDSHRGAAGHMSPAEAGAVAAAARPSRLVLYHLYPPVDAAAALEAVGGVFGGPACVAEDGQVFEVGREPGEDRPGPGADEGSQR